MRLFARKLAENFARTFGDAVGFAGRGLSASFGDVNESDAFGVTATDPFREIEDAMNKNNAEVGGSGKVSGGWCRCCGSNSEHSVSQGTRPQQRREERH